MRMYPNDEKQLEGIHRIQMDHNTLYIEEAPDNGIAVDLNWKEAEELYDNFAGEQTIRPNKILDLYGITEVRIKKQPSVLYLKDEGREETIVAIKDHILLAQLLDAHTDEDWDILDMIGF